MVPILYGATETQFLNNGIGRLSEAITCTVEEERNGIYELTLTYPISGRHFADLAVSRIVMAKASDGAGNQPFRIYKITKPISGVVTVYARHVSNQLNFIPFKPFSASSLANALTGFGTNALEACPFTFTADFTSSASITFPLPASIRSYMGGTRGSIIDTYGNGAEWEFDKFDCKLHRNRGADRGVILRYGKNIIDLTQEENIENTITGVMSFWQSEDVTVYIDAPVESAAAANFPFPRTVVKDFSDRFENAPTKAQLLAYTQNYVSSSGIGVPKVSIDVDFVNLADSLDYKELSDLEAVNLCDIITVRFEKLGIDKKAKVVRMTYDTLKERSTEITIGDLRGSLSTTIEDQIEAVNLRPTYAETKRSIDKATGVLASGKRGHAIFGRTAEGWANELYFVDDENIYQAVKVLRINMNGIGFSSTGISGRYAQSWTLDGRMTLGGVNDAYGNLIIQNETGIPTIQVDKEGLKLWKITAAGYLDNGVMWADADHTTRIRPTRGSFYFDLVEYVTMMWDGTAYTQVTGSQGLLAKMTHSGFGLYEGDIDIKWNGKTGIFFKAGTGSGDSDDLRIGGFKVNLEYGRQIWESDDEKTGMSGEPDTAGQMYLWAGWNGSESQTAFYVDNTTDKGYGNTVIHGGLFVNGRDVEDELDRLWQAVNGSGE